MKYYGLFILAMLLGTATMAQGIIRGKVSDGQDGSPMFSANVVIEGSTKGELTDFDGNYSIEGLAPGTYTVVASFLSYQTQKEANVVVKDGEVTIVNFNLVTDAYVIEEEATVVTRIDRSKDVAMESMKKKEAGMMDYISNQQIKKSGDSDAAGALKRVTGVSTVGNYVFVRGLSDRYIKTTLNGAEVPSLDPKRNSVQMDIFPANLIDNLTVMKTLNSDLPADYSGAYINITTKDFPEEFTFNYSGSFGYNTNATFNDQFLTTETSDTDWIGFDNGFRDIPSSVSGASEVPQQQFSNFYESMVFAGFESELAAIGITEPTDIGNGDDQQTISQIVDQIEGIESVSQVQNEFLPAIREQQNQELSQMTQDFNNDWENRTKTPGLDISQAISFGNRTKLFGKDLGYNFGFQYKKSNRFYDGGNTGRFTLTGNENEKNELETQRLLSDSRGTESVYTSALLNLSYKLNNGNNIGITYMPNVSGVNDSRYQNGINPSDAVGLGQEQRQQRYLERTMQIVQLRGEHVLQDFYNSRITWLGSYTKGVQNTPDLRVFINSYEESEGGTIYLDAEGNDITADALALLADGEILSEYYPGFTTQTTAGGELNYSIEDNLYPSPTRYYRNMQDNTLDLKLNFELPWKGQLELNNMFSLGASYVRKTRDYEEFRYSFISSGLEYEGDPNAYFAPENMNIVPGATSFLYLRDDTDIQNSYTASQDVLGVYAMVDYNVTKKLKVNAGVRMETTDMLLESRKLEEDELTPEQQDEFRGTLDIVDVLPALNLTYQLKQEDLKLTNLRFSASRSVARPMFREKAPYSVFDFEIQEQQTGNPDLTRTVIDNLDLRFESYPNLGEIYSVSLFYKNFTDPIEQVIIPTSSNTEISWVNVARAQVIGAEFEVRKNLYQIADFLRDVSIGANLTIVQSATEIPEGELEEIRGTDPDHEDTRPMYGQSPYLFNAIASYDNDSIGLNIAASFNVAGPQLILITPGGTPDIYDLPRPTLDVTVGKRISEKFYINFKARNL
ncbi:MAG: carboxypeptidase regulatory-like domain-containing protein, partial [Flavobacteriales bacterium]|nr:carboxypeptidase regulatory-like domain-containing protein [Flavobacteriales bacterium]